MVVGSNQSGVQVDRTPDEHTVAPEADTVAEAEAEADERPKSTLLEQPADFTKQNTLSVDQNPQVEPPSGSFGQFLMQVKDLQAR